MDRIKVGIIGPGNIGTDLMYKVMKSKHLQMKMMAGIVESEGIKRAAGLGFETSIHGVDAVAADPEIKIVFDATSAKAHLHDAPILKAAGKIAIDMTPAAVGPYVVPCCNFDKLQDVDNFNMVTCGGQATIPIAYAINQAGDSEYTEIVAALSSKSAGPGTRANIDEFTQTTKKALEVVGGADRAKAIIILNPAEPPVMMTNTIYSIVRNPDEEKITKSVMDMISSMTLAMGAGVAILFSAAGVLVYQGLLVLLASLLAPVLTDVSIALSSQIGSLFLIAIGFNMLGITKIKVANFLPAMFMPFIWQAVQLLF